MDIFKKLKELAGRSPRRINGEAPTRLVERAIIAKRGNTATLTRTPLRGREKGISDG